MVYIPKPDKRAKNLSLLFVAVGFIIMLLTALLPYRAIFQLVALLLIAAGIFILVRYVLSEFRYIISDADDGSSDLIIYKKQGRNDIKVCHISLFNVEDIYRYKEKKMRCDNRYGYNQNITDEKYVLLVREKDKLIEIIIEPDPHFLREIKKRVGGEGGENRLIM